MQEKIFDLLLKEEELSWKNIIFDLVKSEQMDPWDINITLLTHKYLEFVKKMQEHDLKISGKILLAAAVLLKMKSSYLLDNDISKFDALISKEEAIEEESFEDLGPEERERLKKETYPLIPRHPQPRNRKVSIHDLVDALQQAMATKKRILDKIKPIKFHLPEKVDIMEVIGDVYNKLVYYSKKGNSTSVQFSKLLPPRAGREEKVYTFVPLLHLENLEKLEMHQEKPFDEIEITLLKKKEKEE